MKRFLRRWLPLIVSALFTVASIFLAIGGGGEYDATLAVLTATLIALVWTGFFTYLSVTREDPTYVTLAMEYDPDWAALRPLINNPTPRLLTVRITLDVWIEQTWLADFGG